MLLQVPEGEGRTNLVCGSADEIPLADASVDFVSCANVIHHLADPAAFVTSVARLLRPNGCLAVVGLDPHQDRDRWYLYDYFPEARKLDLQRYPSADQVAAWMTASGLESIEIAAAERIREQYKGGAILEDYFLQRKASSQLAILSEGAWAEGLKRIRQAVQEGENSGASPVFEVDLTLVMVCGSKSPARG
jgi:SAM-dependent methyltransferase